jgi:uncharacterized Tic20 family protein
MDTPLSTAQDATPTSDARNWAAAAHISALVAFAVVPFGHVIGPLLVYIFKGKESAFVADHARASLNYQITLSIAAIAAIIIGIFLFVFYVVPHIPPSSPCVHYRDCPQPPMPVAFDRLFFGMIALFGVGGILSLMFILMATMAASSGKPFSYPFAIRFVRP